MTKRKRIENIIWKFPMSSIGKLKLTRKMNILYNYITGKSKLNKSVPLINSNGYYAHEYWMKEYSGWSKPIWGVIEHGVYFGENKGIVGDKKDYSIKRIITYGDYREKLIKNGFPDYQIIKVGPRIAYALTDESYLKKLVDESKGEKVLTIFPAHSTENCKSEYDVDYLISAAEELMQKHGCEYLRVCLKEQDLTNGNAEEFLKRGCNIVSAGLSSVDFLPRLRAIIEASDLTMSNSLGTHLGYCIYLDKPHFLIQQNRGVTGFGEEYLKESDANNPIQIVYKKEEKSFIEEFSSDKEPYISDKQREICDYYWGFSYVKSPSELYNILENIYEA